MSIWPGSKIFSTSPMVNVNIEAFSSVILLISWKDLLYCTYLQTLTERWQQVLNENSVQQSRLHGAPPLLGLFILVR